MNNFAVFCDIGNVLIETAPLIQEAVQLATKKCAESGFDIEPAAFSSTYLALDRVTTRPHINHLYGDRVVAVEALKKLQGKADIRYVGTFLSHYREHIRSQIRPKSDITSFFEALFQLSNVQLGIISDGTTDDQLEILARLGIMRYLNPDLILISEDLGQEKTSTTMYKEGLRRASSEPERTFMIGDNLERDVMIPKRLRIRTVFFSKYVDQGALLTEDIKPDFVCNDFDETLKLLCSIFEQSS